MPAPAGTKRVKGVQIHRPFIYGSYAKPIYPAHRPPNTNADHTHQWTIYIRPLPGQDLTHWLKKVQFKLHETYANSSRMIESPPFEVTETGWGEFEVQMKLYFVPEANEKAQTLWHALKLHPWGEDAEGKKERGESVTSQSYEEVVFSEPVEGFHEILTSGGFAPGVGQQGAGRGGGKGAKGGSKGAIMGRRGGGEKSAEIPEMTTEGNPYSRQTEDVEVGRMREAMRRVEGLRREEGRKKVEREKTMDALSKEGGTAAVGA